MLENHTNEIMIQDDIKVVFRYPILSDMEGMITASSDIESVYKLINKCIKSIHYGDEIYNRIDITEKDIDEFVDQLTGDQFETLVEFFETMPTVKKEIEVTNPNTQVVSKVDIEGMNSFF